VQLLQKDYDSSVMSQESILSNNVYKGEKFFNVVTTNTLKNGRCFTLYPLRETLRFERAYVNLYRNITLQVKSLELHFIRQQKSKLKRKGKFFSL